jgi:predicted transcriptional regulator
VGRDPASLRRVVKSAFAMTATARHLLARHLRHPPAIVNDDAKASAVIIAIKPHYADLIARGEKRVEFRRRLPKRVTAGALAIFYVSSPTRAITMTARIASVERATPAALWRTHGAAGGTTRTAFDAYFAGAAQGVALLLDGVRVLNRPLALADARRVASGFRPPQSVAVLPPQSSLIATVRGAKATERTTGLFDAARPRGR